VAGGIATPDATNALLNFYALDLSKPESAWRELPSWPGPPRMLAVAAAIEDAFCVVGGAELVADERGAAKRRYLRDAYRFDPNHGWRTIASAPFSIAAAPSPAPTIADVGFLIVGSDDGSRALFPPSPTHPGFSGEILLYSVTSDSWCRITTTPAPRATVPAVLWRGRWIIPSGEVRPGVRSSEVWSVNVNAR
jgi:N-acetylneuraminic acid mutarotase